MTSLGKSLFFGSLWLTFYCVQLYWQTSTILAKQGKDKQQNHVDRIWEAFLPQLYGGNYRWIWSISCLAFAWLGRLPPKTWWDPSTNGVISNIRNLVLTCFDLFCLTPSQKLLVLDLQKDLICFLFVGPNWMLQWENSRVELPFCFLVQW